MFPTVRVVDPPQAILEAPKVYVRPVNGLDAARFVTGPVNDPAQFAVTVYWTVLPFSTWPEPGAIDNEKLGGSGFTTTSREQFCDTDPPVPVKLIVYVPGVVAEVVLTVAIVVAFGVAPLFENDTVGGVPLGGFTDAVNVTGLLNPFEPVVFMVIGALAPGLTDWVAGLQDRVKEGVETTGLKLAIALSKNCPPAVIQEEDVKISTGDEP